MLAVRSHDDYELRRYIVVQGAEPVIPGRRNRTVPSDYDRVLYRERNLVERSIGWLKQGHRIATRYEKAAASYLGFVLFAAACQWLRNPFAANVHTPYEHCDVWHASYTYWSGNRVARVPPAVFRVDNLWPDWLGLVLQL